ncbi:hypothetical protein CG740_23175 [Streptomyces sp. CB01201]|uniref:hypothetical protein n=1 Tax=Streptomyces sp. CB01201 TaxID=2020324 RepID=UPI000C27B6EF|nr:hypothetical protein [Streptomyces sp. CB01201]PJN00811.1 hypothetical protein CG740_23175 [Streptomyces sp. CB01201]
MPLPGQRPTVTAGQPDLSHQAQQLLAAVEDALQAPTSYRSTDPTVPSWADGPKIGTAPAVPQPGVPPMSQRSTDIGRTALYCGVATVPPGLIAIGLLLASGQANPTVIGCICAAPAALAAPILAVARLLRGAKEVVAAAPAEIHQHYSGPVHQDQRNVHTRTSGLWAKTHNRQ